MTTTNVWQNNVLQTIEDDDGCIITRIVSIKEMTDSLVDAFATELDASFPRYLEDTLADARIAVGAPAGFPLREPKAHLFLSWLLMRNLRELHSAKEQA